MSNAEVLSTPVDSSHVYRFDPSYKWLVLVGASLILLFCLGALARVVTGAERWSVALVGAVILMAVGAVAIFAYTVRRCQRTVKVNDEGVFVQDGRGNEISSIRWEELGRVSEQRELGKLALWDKSGTRRVLVDQLFQNFALIRSRILDEYAKVFALKPLPVEFRNSHPLNYQSLLMAACVAFFAWVAWSSYQQDPRGPAPVFGFFGIVCLVSLLKLFPGIRGPSLLFEDRIVLRSLFKTRELCKKDVVGVDLRDRANSSGTRFSFVVLRTVSGEEMKITFAYGDIPDIYLTLRGWLAR